MLPESEPFLKEPECPSQKHRSSILYKHLLGPFEVSKKRVGTAWLPSLLSHCLVFFLTSLSWGAVFFITASHIHLGRGSQSVRQSASLETYDYRANNITTNNKLLTCGRNTPEAKDLGCKYDILSNHWVPRVCMDQEAVEEYQADGSWFGYADESRTELLSIDSMSEKEFYYTSERDHIVHCAMLWRKQFRAFYEERTMLDTLIASWEHTMHCSQFLVDMSDHGPDYRNMPIKTWVGYAGCWVGSDDET